MSLNDLNYKDDIVDQNQLQSNIESRLLTGPTLSIVTTSEALNYLKMEDDSVDGDLVNDLVKASTAIIERELGGMAICEQTWFQTQNGGVDKIRLKRQPIIGTPTVSYYEDFDTTTATNITYSTYFKVIQPNKLIHADGYFKTGRQDGAYEITYKCGMFTASNYTSSDDPRLQTLKTAILRTVAWLYEQREEYATDIKEGQWQVSYGNDLPLGIKRLIMPLHTGENLI